MKILREIITPLILWSQMILLNVVNANYDILETTIKDGDTEIHLKWRKTQQWLANLHVPVWLVEAIYGEAPQRLPLDFLEDNIGEFVMYHDLRKSSAVVYFKKLDALYGLVDTRYFIDGIPMSKLHLVHSIGPYVKFSANSRGEPMHLRTNNVPVTYNQDYYNDEEESATSETGVPLKKRFRSNVEDQQAITVLYPELLIIVPSDIVKMTKTKGPNFICTIIRDHIIIFNAIDMMMGKLSTHDIKIHLNIAGILIDHKKAFPLRLINYNLHPNCPIPSNAIDVLDADRAIANFKMFLKEHKDIFVPHSFDFYFASSTKMVFMDSEAVYGVSDVHFQYMERLYSRYYNKLQGLIVHRGLAYDYVIASHEIGHLLGLDHEPRIRTSTNFVDEECNAVMQETGAYCPKCLEWTNTSVMQLRDFVGQNRNHCYLLNKPRSLHPYGYVMKTLSPAEQCRCHGFEPRLSLNPNYLNVISPSRCKRKLRCTNHNLDTPLPIDGTPCDDNNKVCWNGNCKKVNTEL